MMHGVCCGARVVISEDVFPEFKEEYLKKLSSVTIYTEPKEGGQVALWPGNEGTEFVVVPETEAKRQVKNGSCQAAIVSDEGDGWICLHSSRKIFLPEIE